MLWRIARQLSICSIVIMTALFISITGASAESRNLDKDTELHPQGWSVGDFVKFKKGTVVTLNDLGEVVSGTLDKDTFLLPRGWQRVINDYYYTTVQTDLGPYLYRYYYPFVNRKYEVAVPGYGHLRYKGGTAVTFSEQGEVISGTLADKATVRLVGERYGFVTFQQGSVLVFYASGAVLSGFLHEDTYLRPFGWQHLLSSDDSAGFIKFSRKKQVAFTENGEVTSGTVKEAVTLRDRDGSSRSFPAGSTVNFLDVSISPEQ